MRLIDIVDARDALQKLVMQDLPLRTAYNLMSLTDECNKHLNFYYNELAKFNPEENPARLKELENLEVNIEGITIYLDNSIKLSAADVKMLFPLIKFKGDD